MQEIDIRFDVYGYVIMAEGSEESEWPTVSVRIPEKDLEIVKAAAADEEHEYSQSHIIRYSIDRKFEHRENWESETAPDPVLDNLIEEYRTKFEEGELELGEYTGDEESQEDTDMNGVELVLNGEGELEENSFEYGMTMYAIGLEEGNETIQELSRQYLEENFPDRTFTKYLGEEL